jgi:hypothetical protein
MFFFSLCSLNKGKNIRERRRRQKPFKKLFLDVKQNVREK